MGVEPTPLTSLGYLPCHTIGGCYNPASVFCNKPDGTIMVKPVMLNLMNTLNKLVYHEIQRKQIYEIL